LWHRGIVELGLPTELVSDLAPVAILSGTLSPMHCCIHLHCDHSLLDTTQMTPQMTSLLSCSAGKVCMIDSLAVVLPSSSLVPADVVVPE